MSDQVNINGTISFTDSYGKRIELVDEVKKLRASVDILVRLSNVRIGSVNLDALGVLQPFWFDKVYSEFGAGWNSSGSVVVGSEVEHYETGIKTRLPYGLTTPDDRWTFINTIKLIIASSKNSTRPLSVEEVIRAVVSKHPLVDAVTGVGALAAVCREIKMDGVRPEEIPAPVPQPA